MALPHESLGAFLRSRRARLDPASFGFSGRRRTPGLRREEVAQRAHISPTWYTWLEQGRGGAASPEVLERLAAALLLTDTEREHLFILGLGRPPEPRHTPDEGVSPRLQRVLDALRDCPAIIKTALWDVVAWNRAAAVVFTDYGALPPAGRHIMRILFLDPAVRARQHDWEGLSRFVVATFRADVARFGRSAQASDLVDELSSASPEFEALWRGNDVLSHADGDGIKRIRHAQLGSVALEYSAFAVDGRPDLSMIVYTPLQAGITERIRALAARG